jgi:hypothetical protein
MVPFTAGAATESGTCGTNVNWTFDTETKVLTITGTGNFVRTMDDYYEGSPPVRAPWYGKGYKEVVISNVKNIGNDAFVYGYSLEKVTIPDTVTSIGTGAFSSCTHLTSVDIPSSVTSIGNSAFAGCSVLSEVNIPEGVTTIGTAAFGSCYKIRTITIPSTVTSIGNHAFSYCTGLYNYICLSDNVQYPNGQYDAVFEQYPTGFNVYCADGSTTETYVENKGLVNTTVNNIDYSQKCGDNAYWYYNETKKEVLIFGSGNMYSYEYNYSHSPWFNDQDVEKVTIDSGVTSVGQYSFYGCSNLEKVYLPGTLESIGSFAFANCTSLESIALPANVSSLQLSSFSNCSNLKSITVDEDNSNYSSENGILYNKDKTTLVLYPYGKEDSIFVVPDSVTKIGQGSLMNCSKVETIVIPDSVTDLFIYGNGYAGTTINNCSNLKTISLGSGIRGDITPNFLSGCPNVETLIVHYGATYKSANHGVTVYPLEDLEGLTVYGYPGSTSESYCNERGIDYENIYTADDDTEVIVGEPIEHDAADAKWLNYDLTNLNVLGVQIRQEYLKNKDMRFVVAANSDMLKDADEYGFIVGKSDEADVAVARGYASKAKYGEDENCATIDCTGTSNLISGDFGNYDADTPYKYVTLALENVPNDKTVVVRFFVKKGDNIWYSRYMKDQTVYKNFYKGLAVNWDAINNA